MGVSQSTKSYGPKYTDAVINIEPREADRSRLRPNQGESESEPLLTTNGLYAEPFPYKRSRLKEIPYKQIIERGEPWNDPTFPHGPQALFIDGVKHQSHNSWEYIPNQRFYWRRASDHFKDHNSKTLVFDGIDPTDIVQGKLADCYFLAALAGLAEDSPEKAHLQLGERIRDNYLVKETNAAGIYAIEMCVDGEPLVVCVDDWFPFYRDTKGVEKFCFARNKAGELNDGEGEMWVMLIEKAWAKVCGSYEAAEMGTASEALNNIDGTPCQQFFMGEVERRGEQALLWDILEEADRTRYVVTCSVDSTARSNPDTLKEFGLCDFHSYTMLQCLAVKLYPKGQQNRYLMKLRNPWGKKEWLGPWSDYSATWDKYPYVHQQLRQREDKSQRSQASTGTLGAADDGSFWILFKDFFRFFYCVTVNYTRDDFFLTRIAEEIDDEKWGVSRLVLPKDTDMLFVSIFQMNQKFFDPEEDFVDVVTTQQVSEQQDLASRLVNLQVNDQVEDENRARNESDHYADKGPGVPKPKGQGEEMDQREKFAQKDIEYPKLELIICKRGCLKPNSDEKLNEKPEEVIAYLEGTEGNEPCLQIRLNQLTKGEYFILYRPDFKPWHLVKRLNVVVYSEFQPKKSELEYKNWEQGMLLKNSQDNMIKSQQSLKPIVSQDAIKKVDQSAPEHEDEKQDEENPPNEDGEVLQSELPSKPLRPPSPLRPASQAEIDKFVDRSDRARALSASRKSYSRYSRRTLPPWYDPELAIELERLKLSSFKKDFFEKMEELNYDRFIDQEKYKPPEFMEPS